MTTVTPKVGQTDHSSSRQNSNASRPLFFGAASSEWVKLRGTRATYWTLLVAAVAMVGLGALFASRYTHFSTSQKASISPASYSLSGFFLAQLAIGVLGVLVMTSEYSTGTIRPTLIALPQRLILLAAKAFTLLTVTGPIVIASSFAAFFAGQAILPAGVRVHLGEGGVLRSVFGAALYLMLLGLGSLALGCLIRRTAGAIAAVVGVVFVLPGLIGALPTSWQNVTRFLPSSAGQAIIGHTRFLSSANHTVLTPWVGLGIFCAYIAVALFAAGVNLTRRDA